MWQRIKNIGHFFEAHMWRLLYGMPDAGMHIYGITGTNGKTTTTYLLTSILEQAYGKEHLGMLTTVAFRIGNTEEINTSKMTTLPSRRVFSYLARMKRAGVTHVVLEVTSHALDQHRLAGVTLMGAIILNIAREHLDYHKTMKYYAAAKGKIVAMLAPHAPLVAKFDDPLVKTIGFGAKMRGMQVVWMKQSDIEQTITPLVGSINKENAAAASLLAHAVGISQEHIRAGIAAVEKVPGRMEIVERNGITVVIDYAVTPDALDRLYKDMKEKTTGKLMGILGAAGLRDRGKRPDMARAAAKYADRLIITREDPWTEPEEQIFTDLEAGLTDASISWERIVDRKEAIKTLIQSAKPGDCIIVTGKGAERGMALKDGIIPWNEREIVEELLQNA